MVQGVVSVPGAMAYDKYAHCTCISFTLCWAFSLYKGMLRSISVTFPVNFKRSLSIYFSFSANSTAANRNPIRLEGAGLIEEQGKVVLKVASFSTKIQICYFVFSFIII